MTKQYKLYASIALSACLMFLASPVMAADDSAAATALAPCGVQPAPGSCAVLCAQGATITGYGSGTVSVSCPSGFSDSSTFTGVGVARASGGSGIGSCSMSGIGVFICGPA